MLAAVTIGAVILLTWAQLWGNSAVFDISDIYRQLSKIIRLVINVNLSHHLSTLFCAV